MKRKVFICIVVLMIIIGITAYLNKGDLDIRKASQENEVVVLIADGRELLEFDMDFVKTLESVKVEGNLKKNGEDAVKQVYTGVPLKKVFKALDISLDDASRVVVKAADGYISALTVDEVKDDDNVYLAYEINGQPLGKKIDGGTGPFQVILTKDAFSQRWCKFVMEIEIQ